MRKFIIGILAIAMLAIPSVASANVPRCAAPVTEAATATFTTTTPSGAGGLWTTTFNVTVQPDGSFAGTGTTSGQDVDGIKTIDEIVTGKFNSDNTVSFTSNRPQPLYTATWTLTNAPMDGVTETIATVNVNWTVAVKVTAPVFSVEATTDLNHGQYVKAQGGGKDAAQACAGMPLNSTQGGKK